jgi:two-component system, NtrC family, sensor kinase
MKIISKVMLFNVFNVALIALLGGLAFRNLDLILTKLRFVEIADDLNKSFLEMRLLEKNFFLYKEETAILEIKKKIDKTMGSIESMSKDILRATDGKNVGLLKSYIREYSEVIEEVIRSNNRNTQLETRLRATGRKLREFSENITRIERMQMNEIIWNTKPVFFFSYLAILLSAVIISYCISRNIVRSLRQIERAANSISKGNFQKIEGVRRNDECGSVIDAINSMYEELRNREEMIIQSKKLASLGVLTAGVAHELTNPLNNISMIAQNYREHYDYLDRENRIGLMKKVEEEAERIEKIVRNLLDFSKPKSIDLKKADINDTIRDALRLTQNSLDVSNIELKLTLEPLPRIFIDAHQIQQCFVNLIINAVQAMSPGGVLSIETRLGDSKDFLEIDVKDTGRGIRPEYLPHLFDPFFSTKGVGGTGLGLSVSYGIIKKHKGNIRVKSEVGVGTTFTVELPIEIPTALPFYKGSV